MDSGFGNDVHNVRGIEYRTDDDDDIDEQALDEESERLLQCHAEYKDIKANQTIGLMEDDYARSRAYHGNTRRLSVFLEKLQSRQKPVTVVSHGGSISLGHGIFPWDGTYSDVFVKWLNDYYPVASTNNESTTHTLINHARYGADICYVAKYFNYLDVPADTDLFILEFAVNDYEGQDELLWVDQKTDIFFDGFERLTFCGEAVVRKLLTMYPNAAIVFLEFRSAVMSRKTAQLLHTGVAQHYQVPIISYDDAIFPKFWDLLRLLNRSESYSLPIGDTNTIQPFPFGCHECQTDHIDDQFRPWGCHTACHFWMYAGFGSEKLKCDPKDMPPGRVPCYTAFFSHDDVHPSWFGHQVARDLLIELLAVTSKDICLEKSKLLPSNNDTEPSFARTNHILQRFGVYASEEFLAKQTDFVLVETTNAYFAKKALEASNKSDGFSLSTGGHGSMGWYSNNTAGGEYVEFEIELPIGECYVVYLASIKSYERMGNFQITMTDMSTQKVSSVVVDGVWKPRISIPFDTQINIDDDADSCTGKCKINVSSYPEVPGRGGNLIKITDLSVRHCYDRNSEGKQINPNDPDPGPWIAL